jgi:hypothetical protein
MQMRTLFRTAAPSCLMALAFTAAADAQQLSSNPHPDGTAAIASEAFVYGYPLVSMHVTRRVMTNVARPMPNARAPLNQFGSLFAFPTPEFKDVVSPNVNTLYTSGWFDLSAEPMIIHVPDTQGRYYVMQMLDAWTNVFASAGKRTTGTMAQDIAIVGPLWHGKLPAGISHTHVSQTNTVWIINRIETHGMADFPVVNALQREITATPLSMFGRSYMPPSGTVDPSVDMTKSPMKQVNMMSAEEFFNVLALELKTNPPASSDTALIGRMMSIGIVPGQPFEMAKMNRNTATEIRNGARTGLMTIQKHAMKMGLIQNHWQTLNMCGQFGTDYLTRAGVAMVGLGCNLPQDALYPTTMMDAQGNPLTGMSQYVLHFPAGQLPPVNAFWSVTMYDSSHSLVPNPMNRFAISSYDQMKMNPDGSLDIFVQRESPGMDKAANWLPAPAGKFVLTLREYWPKEQALSGAWAPPGVMKTP